MLLLFLLFGAFLLELTRAVESLTPWTQYIYAPDSRTPTPISIKQTTGAVHVHNKASATLQANGQITFDFGREVSGHITFSIISPMPNAPISLAFTESPQFIGAWSDDTGASPFSDWDRALSVVLPSNATSPTSPYQYTTPPERYRGGFRYLTVTANATLVGSVKVSGVTCLLGYQPGVQNPQKAYRGYFYTPDDKVLVRTWYAGAYTVQTNISPANTGRFLPQVRPGWAYNASLGLDGPMLLDGAKRDRAVWPGDLGISAPSSYLAFGPKYGYESVVNALETLFYFQNATTGMFPFAGPDTNSFKNGAKSDTYHSWSLIAIADYSLYSGDEAFISRHWPNITRAVDYIVSTITPDGLQNQAWTNDWARQGGGGLNSALNAISYGVLRAFSSIALSRDATLANKWNSTADALKASYNRILWDDSVGLYRDNATTSLAPQDGNALAVFFGLTNSTAQARKVSQGLTKNWNDIGPVTPELPDTISPFVSSWEVEAHFAAEEPERAVQLIRKLWGYALDGPNMGGSTIVEGLSANGSLYYRSEAGYNYDPAYTSMAHFLVHRTDPESHYASLRSACDIVCRKNMGVRSIYRDRRAEAGSGRFRDTSWNI
ncbi:bacterial alpha-L-rhamnosidase domain-containing protein [Flagelloscypha sp. PMI_526]|nr:bacterial alpha-L-rhamnosidase domain-containing protein [Flagelloscypha sp. PMI_526]